MLRNIESIDMEQEPEAFLMSALGDAQLCLTVAQLAFIYTDTIEDKKGLKKQVRLVKSLLNEISNKLNQQKPKLQIVRNENE